MLINKITAGLRSLINQYSEVETPFSDHFLYHLFASNAVRLVKQKEEKNHKLSDWTVKYYPLATELAKSHEFGCYPSCDVLKVKYQVPKPITARNRDIIKVYTFDFQEIPYVNPAYAPALQYDEIKKNKVHYSIIDQFIVLWNANTKHIVPKAILVAGRFEDPTLWADIPACDADGNPTNVSCYDPYTEDFPIEGDLIDVCYRMCLELLNLPLQIPSDKLNEQQTQ